MDRLALTMKRPMGLLAGCLLLSAVAPLSSGCGSDDNAAGSSVSESTDATADTGGSGGSAQTPDAPAKPDVSTDDAFTGADVSQSADVASEADASSQVDAPRAVDVGLEGDAASVVDATDGEAGFEASVDATSEEPPAIDAGAGCLSPGVESPLSAAGAGLPVDGLALWVRGDRGVYMTAQNRVCAWADQSGGGRLLRPSSIRPLWLGTGLGTQPAIRFDAVGTDLYTDVLGFSATSARTFIAVAQLVSTTGRFHPILQGVGSSASTYVGIDTNTWQTAGSREGVYITNNSFDAVLATSTSAHVHVLTISTLVVGTALPGAIDYRVNGATQTFTRKVGSGTIGSFAGANFTSIGVVSGTPSTGVYGDAIIAEAIIYDRALTIDERTAVETALKTRYAIP